MNNTATIVRFLCWLFLLGGLPFRLAGQTSQPSPPPLPRFPAGDIAYAVSITYHSAAGSPAPADTPAAAANPAMSGNGKPAPQITGVRVTSINRLVRYQITSTGGITSEHWVESKSGLEFSQDLRGQAVFLSSLNTGPGSFTSVLGPMNDLFAPVGPGNYAGRKDQGGALCYIYKWTVVVLPWSIDYQAWVNVKTGTLVAIDDGHALYKFSFDPTPPPGPLVMPPAFQARLDRYREKTKPIEHL